MESLYQKDKNNAIKTGKVWIVIIGSITCGPCINLENALKSRKVITTKLEYNSKEAIKISRFYQSKGEEKVTGWPDWAIIRYENNKVVYFNRFLGYSLNTNLDLMIKEAETQEKLSYKK